MYMCVYLYMCVSCMDMFLHMCFCYRFVYNIHNLCICYTTGAQFLCTAHADFALRTLYKRYTVYILICFSSLYCNINVYRILFTFLFSARCSTYDSVSK